MSQFQQIRHFHLSLKQILIGGLGSGIGLLGILFAVAAYVVEMITHPKKAMFGDSYTFSPYELDLPAEEVVFPPRHGDYQVRLGAVAYSMGAAVAIMSCARNTDVEALVLDSSFATHRSAVDYNFRHVFPLPPAPFVWIADYLLWWRAGYRFSQVEPLRDIARIAPRPILLIHSLKDSIVDPHDASLLYAAAGEPKELWFVPGVDHCGAYFADRAIYTAKVIGFFERHLKSNPRLHLVEQVPTERGKTETAGASSSLNAHLSEAS